MQILTFRVGAVTFGVAIDTVQSIGRMQEITEIPNSPKYIKGIIMQHEDIIPVYCLTKLFWNTEEAKNQDEELIIVGIKDNKIAFMVPEVYGIKEVSKEHVRMLPEMLHGEKSVADSIADVDKKLIVMLDAEKMMASEEYQELKETVENA